MALLVNINRDKKSKAAKREDFHPYQAKIKKMRKYHEKKRLERMTPEQRQEEEIFNKIRARAMQLNHTDENTEWFKIKDYKKDGEKKDKH